ncbi:Mapk Regulated Corepressor Interacting Protein 2 [Manis pentadactyla]|nr:Mapk Regulated Corepressor Interacting Protein 2 [Manis pentadactyla]
MPRGPSPGSAGPEQLVTQRRLGPAQRGLRGAAGGSSPRPPHPGCPHGAFAATAASSSPVSGGTNSGR